MTTTTKTKSTTLEFWGGYHYNAAPVRVKIQASADEIQANGYGTYLSAGQQAKLARHFCGIKGCTCGADYRAKMEIVG